METVAILCCSPRSVYKKLTGVDCYDIHRDARTFPGGKRVVAHPPCRPWSNKCRHQAKPEPGESELGLWCVEQVQKWGGVLEQPAHSHLWAVAGLPRPCSRPGWSAQGNSWSIEVWQAWWGYPMRKATWLYFCGVSPTEVNYPLRLHAAGADMRREQLMSHAARSATTREFAEWLIDVARKAKTP